jgi:hypothetical protein
MASKRKGLTLAILGLKPKGGGDNSSAGDETDAVSDADNGTSNSGDELPLGLVEAVTEFADAETDDDKARAFLNAVQLCRE